MKKMMVLRNIVQRFTLVRFLQAACLVSIVLLAGRIAYTGKLAYAFLVWNLFLAWVPYGVTVALERLEQSREQSLSVVFPLYVVWLLFFPNAPYILTDFIHLDRLTIGAVPLWYDACLIGAFGVAGLVFGLRSLHLIHISLRKRFGWVMGWFSVALVSLLSGFGVYLGRFPRWNSWDVLADPLGFVRDVIDRLSSPVEHPNLIGVTLSFTLLIFGSYVLYRFFAMILNRFLEQE